MADVQPEGISPVAPHSSTPRELTERLAAERTGRPHLIYRDLGGHQMIHMLAATGGAVTIGRREECDVRLDWDGEVSRVHAELRAVGYEWAVVDDGLSRNGSFVNAERLQGRRRLRDGDELVVGHTTIVFRSPIEAGDRSTTPGRDATLVTTVTPADRRVLVALCRPLREHASPLPATNRAIAEELCLSVPAIKKRLGALFIRFDLDHLPQSEKRARLALEALQRGIVTVRDL